MADSYKKMAHLDFALELSLEIAKAITSREVFRSQTQILVHIFYNKSPATVLKRCNSLARLCNRWTDVGIGFPCREDAMYMYICREGDAGCFPSRLASLLESISFQDMSLESLNLNLVSR